MLRKILLIIIILSNSNEFDELRKKFEKTLKRAEKIFTKKAKEENSINAKEKFTVTLTYDTSIERRFIMRLSYLESSNKYVEQKNACFIDQQKTSATMTCYVNNKGTYKFKVF